MVNVLLIVGVAAIVALAIVAVSRANEIFCVSIRQGRCLVIRGHVSPAIWRELTQVVRMARVERGRVRAVKSGGAARIVTDGVDPGVTQRLRNALGTTGFMHATASASSSKEGRNLGQLLGIAWLAWMLSGRR